MIVSRKDSASFAERPTSNHPIIPQQAEVPRSIHLLRYLPRRRDFDWRGLDAAAVRSADDLPPYLVLGPLDTASFRLSDEGWSARWQGTEADTWFELRHDAARQQWVARDQWRGLDGCVSHFNTRIPLPVMIGQGMYGRSAGNWDSAVKSLLEATYQLKVVEPQENAPGFCGIPDGPLRTIAFPMAVCALRGFRDRLQACLLEWQVPYPVVADASLSYQGVCVHEGEATGWTEGTQPAEAFLRSVRETGLQASGHPRREQAPGKPTTWTQSRELYMVFLSLPFAGLTDLLQRLASSDGPIRRVLDPALRFEWRPLVLLAGYEHLAADIAYGDEPRTTLVYLRFQPIAEWGKGAALEKVVDGMRHAEADLARAEAISAEVVAQVERAAGKPTRDELAHDDEADLGYRPDGYVREEESVEDLIAQIKGSASRKMARDLVEQGRADRAVLLARSLLPEAVQILEASDPRFMGGNYLPPLEPGEVEVARITLESTTADVTAVYACQTKEGGFQYRVVDEYGGEGLLEPHAAKSSKPMSMGEFAGFLLHACGLVETLQDNFGDDVEEALAFFSVESDFYPELDRVCRQIVARQLGLEGEGRA